MSATIAISIRAGIPPPVQPPASSAAPYLAVSPRMLSCLYCRILRNSLAGDQGLMVLYNGLTHRFPLPPLRIHSSTNQSRTIRSQDQEMRSSKSAVRRRTSQAWTRMQALQCHAHTYTIHSLATQPPWIRFNYRCLERLQRQERCRCTKRGFGAAAASVSKRVHEPAADGCHDTGGGAVEVGQCR